MCSLCLISVIFCWDVTVICVILSVCSVVELIICASAHEVYDLGRVFAQDAAWATAGICARAA